jgi:Ser/Thr protein kinase RdoA (MazF antagonist)
VVADPLALETIRAAVQPHLPAPVTGLQRIAGSVANQDFLVSTDLGGFLVKVSDRAELAAEAWACARVRRAGVVAPEVVAVEPSPAALPAGLLVLRLFPGRALELGERGDNEENDEFLVEVGRQLALLHSLTLPGYGSLSAGPAAPTTLTAADPSGPHQEWRPFTLEPLEALPDLVGAGVVPASMAARTASALHRQTASVTFEQPGSVLHGDLKAQHLFAEHGRYVGIIDWGDVTVGDPRWDLARLSMSGQRVLTRVLEGYGSTLDVSTEVSLAVYRVLWNLRALAYELRAGGDWFSAYRSRIEADLDSRLLS